MSLIFHNVGELVIELDNDRSIQFIDRTDIVKPPAKIGRPGVGKRKYVQRKTYTKKDNMIQYISGLKVGESFLINDFQKWSGVSDKNLYRYNSLLKNLVL